MDLRIIDINAFDKFIIEKYNSFLNNSNSLIYHRIEYGRLLSDILLCKGIYHLFFNNNDEIIFSFPLFIKQSYYGKVINSLPFFGSIGDFLFSKNEINSFNTYRVIIRDIVANYLKEDDIISFTIISNPFNNFSISLLIDDIIKYVNNRLFLNYKLYIDIRLLYLTRFSLVSEFDDFLYSIVESSTKRNINKAKKLGIKVIKDISKINLLKEIHYENMKKINGKSKPEEFFVKIFDYFKPSTDFDIYVAYFDNKVIAGLLVMYHKDTIEYFIPVIKQEYRSTQALSYIIYNCMRENFYKGYKVFNWGGTHLDQINLIRFKKKWANILSYYYYFTFFNMKKYNLVKQKINEIKNDFSYFYVIPFRYFFNG
jgi:hypothetical protein